MLRRFGSHVRNQWIGTVALFLVLSGGTAMAVDGSLPGQNTVGSEDIINGDVLSTDIANGRIFNVDLADNLITGAKMKDDTLTGADVSESSLNLAAEGWHELGAPGEPSLNATSSCVWKNYDNGVSHNTAAFLRDRHGFVHLKGMVDLENLSIDGCSFNIPVHAKIFTLPNGYRPAKREVLVSISNGVLARISVDGPGAFNQPAGAVSVGGPPSLDDVKEWVSLDGLSFRCAPSGSNGCP